MGHDHLGLPAHLLQLYPDLGGQGNDEGAGLQGFSPVLLKSVRRHVRDAIDHHVPQLLDLNEAKQFLGRQIKPAGRFSGSQ